MWELCPQFIKANTVDGDRLPVKGINILSKCCPYVLNTCTCIVLCIASLSKIAVSERLPRTWKREEIFPSILSEQC